MQSNTSHPDDIQPDYYLHNPELAERDHKARPPMEAYLYFPHGYEITEFNPKKPHKAFRKIFNGVEYNSYENSKYAELLKEIAKYEEKTKITTPSFISLFPPNWKESETRRFLQGAEFNITKAMTALITHFKWREQSFPMTINLTVHKVINSGFMYIHGRDHCYRPILVVKGSIFNQLKPEIDNMDDWEGAIIFYMEYLINYMLIPGQVENWIIISDVHNFSMVFPPPEVKKIISVLQSNYQCRLYSNFIVGMSAGLRFVANIVMTFLEKSTAQKIKILETDNFTEIMKFVNEENLEQKYGGKATNLIPGDNNIFPPVMPSNNFLRSDENREEVLISEENYKELYLKNKLCAVSPHFLKKWEEEEKELREREKAILEAEEKAKMKDDSRSVSISNNPENTGKNKLTVITEYSQEDDYSEFRPLKNENSFIARESSIIPRFQKIKASIKMCLKEKNLLSDSSPDILEFSKNKESISTPNQDTCTCNTLSPNV